MLFKTLAIIGEILNQHNITWAVGASLVLNHHGLVEQPNDIDLLINQRDVEIVDKLLSNLGTKKVQGIRGIYTTATFFEYNIDGVDVDLIADFGIRTSEGNYSFQLDTLSIVETSTIHQATINLTSLEDWYIFYQLIPNRDKKVQLIEQYFLKNGIQNPALLQRAIQSNLPSTIQQKVNTLFMQVSAY